MLLDNDATSPENLHQYLKRIVACYEQYKIFLIHYILFHPQIHYLQIHKIYIRSELFSVHQCPKNNKA